MKKTALIFIIIFLLVVLLGLLIYKLVNKENKTAASTFSPIMSQTPANVLPANPTIAPVTTDVQAANNQNTGIVNPVTDSYEADVKAIFTELLKRAPTPDESKYHLSSLRAGKSTLQTVRDEIKAGFEYTSLQKSTITSSGQVATSKPVIPIKTNELGLEVDEDNNIINRIEITKDTKRTIFNKRIYDKVFAARGWENPYLKN